MSFPLPHVLVLLNLSRRPVLLPGEAARRVVLLLSIVPLPACLPRAILSSVRPLSFRFSTCRAGRLAMCVRQLLVITDVMRMSFGCVFLGSITPRLSIAPPLDTDGGEGSEAASLLAFFGFLLLCADFVDRVHCGCRGCFPMVYCHCVVREDEHGSGSSEFFGLFFYSDFRSVLP